MFDFETELKNLPDKPGVYLMENKNNEIIYVGKAKVLKNRVRQYFQKSNKHSLKVEKMVSNVASFEYIITDSEREALALECNLIKKYSPKYNILLKDDKHFPYIKITAGGTSPDAQWPRLIVTRKQEKDGAKYFGPYQSMDTIKGTIEILRSIFHIPTCKKVFPRDIGKERSCLNHHMGKCFAPCQGNTTEAEYRDAFQHISAFLNGKHGELLRDYETKMKDAAANMEFAKAAMYRDRISAITALSERQKAISTGEEDEDVVGFFIADEKCFVEIFFVRNGKVVGRKSLTIDDVVGMGEDEIMAEFMKQFYDDSDYIPKEILIGVTIADVESISAWLDEKRGGRVYLTVPQKGDKVKMLAMVTKNAQMSADLYKLNKIKYETDNKVLGNLSKYLGNGQNIRRIEAYDISNISGTDNVGGMIVYINGKPDKREYRRFKIKYVDGMDDYGAMSEMLYRRFSHSDREDDERFSDMPDVIFMDGGVGHVHIATKVLSDLGLAFAVFGMVKDDRHRTRGLIDANGKEVFIPLNSAVFNFIAGMQEEVHRYAINYHKSLRAKAMKKSVLTKIRGVSDARAKILMKAFSSVTVIKSASYEEICAVKGIDKTTAKNIVEYFMSEKI